MSEQNTVTMKYKEVVALWNAIFEISGKKGTKFAYAVIKTKQNITPVVDELMKLQLPPRDYVAYDTKRIEICKEYSEKDEKGNPKTNGNNFIIAEDRKAEFEAKIVEHNEANSEVQKAFLNQVCDYNKKLDENVEVNIHKIPLSQFPPDMSTEELEKFLPLVFDDSLH